jgi:hypothetical protein
MIGRLLVPVAGTIAALIAIALAREPRGPIPDPTLPRGREHVEPEEESPPAPEPRNPDAQTFRLELQSDGALLDLEEKSRFASLDDFLGQVPGPDHVIVLSKGKGTTEAALLDAVAKLEGTKRSDGTPRFDAVRAHRPPESKTYRIEVAADGTLRDLDQETTFASVEKLLERLGEARHTLNVSNADGVAEAAVDEVVAKLRDAKLPDGDPRFLVRKVYRAPEAPPGD